jgi:CRISPR-associated protein Cmr4
LRGKIRSELEQGDLKDAAGMFFGQKIKDGNQPTEGEVWFADATLLFFPIASLSHHLVWITCPLWLDRWSRWLGDKGSAVQTLTQICRQDLSDDGEKSAITSFKCDQLYLQTALLKQKDLVANFDFHPVLTLLDTVLKDGGLLSQLKDRLIVLTDEDCIALLEIGLQREVRVALKQDEKTVQGGSFRSEEAIPPEAILFFPWGTKAERLFQADPKMKSELVDEARKKHKNKLEKNGEVCSELNNVLKARLQFGGLEGLGRGWTSLTTNEISEGE